MKKEFFDSCAEKWGSPNEEKLELIKQNILPLLELKKGERVLDACCGTGVLIPLLKDAGAKITGIDYSEKMIEKAEERYGESARFIAGNVEDIPFKNESFDKIIMHNSFPHIDGKKKMFAQCYRTLKSGGIFLISHDMSRKDTDEHHKKCHHSVSSDMLPSNKEITLFAASSGFETIEILDEESFFAIVCRK
ncbi:MAG: class I SAM-dependent methyltransferase [Endomicrobia bacterium]|nr:class I SAM-dependent methyltransferase [Endomicrobiia bacterium]